MGVICAYRSTQTALWYNSAKESSAMAQIRAAATATVAVTATAGETGVFGGNYLSKANAGAARAAMWPGFENTPSGLPFAILCRIIPRWTGTPAAVDVLTMCSANSQSGGTINLALTATGQLRLRYADADGQVATNINTTGTYTGYTSGTAVDLMVSWDGTTTAGSVHFGINGTAFETQTASTAMYATPGQINRCGICVGIGPSAAIGNFDLNEFVIFDGTQSVSAGVRTAFWTVANTDLSVFSDPGVANVIANTTYAQAGVSETGSYVTVAVTNVKNGITYGPGSNTTGSLNSTGSGLAARSGWYKTIG